MSEYYSLYVTCATKDEALVIARTLVEEKLAACGNVIGGTMSVYTWREKLCEDAEAALILKTSGDRRDRAIARIRELHSFEVPCVVAWPIDGGNPAYLDWIRDSMES